MTGGVLPVDEAIRWRWATRAFAPARDLDDDVLARVLEDAHLAPSGFNLQPTHLVVVRGDARRSLAAAAFGQRQLTEAPVTVVVVADTRPDLAHGREMIAMDLRAGAISADYAKFLSRTIRVAFARGPLGVVGALQRLVCRAGSFLRAMPRWPATRPREWAITQAMLVAGHLILSAAARGVASCPMEGFDERRVRRVLGIPRRYVVALLVPLGYSASGAAGAEGAGAAPPRAEPRRTRLPLERLVHHDAWGRSARALTPRAEEPK